MITLEIFPPTVAGQCIPTIFDLHSVIDEVLYLDGSNTVDPSLRPNVILSLDALTLGDIMDGTLYVCVYVHACVCVCVCVCICMWYFPVTTNQTLTPLKHFRTRSPICMWPNHIRSFSGIPGGCQWSLQTGSYKNLFWILLVLSWHPCDSHMGTHLLFVVQWWYTTPQKLSWVTEDNWPLHIIHPVILFCTTQHFLIPYASTHKWLKIFKYKWKSLNHNTILINSW